MRLGRLALAALAALLATPAVAAPEGSAAQSILLGESITLAAPSLGDERTVNIYLPPAYAAEPGRRFPVLYLIDGGVDQDLIHIVGTTQLNAIWGRSGDVIVVGLATKDRRRELTGPTADKELLARYPTAGDSAGFRAFIREVVKPFVEQNYRTDGRGGVIGESLAGLFIVETWLREPDLFGSYAAISPSLWWDKEALALGAASLIGPRQAGHPLLLATANEGADLQVPVDRLVAALGKARDWCYAPQPALTHATIYHAVSPMALQFLFPPAAAPDPKAGFEVECSRKS